MKKRKPIKELVGSPLGLYDSGSLNTESVTAEKVIDVTDICPKAKKVVIKYAKVTRGRIAQICNWYEAEKDFGSTLHYHINEMTVSDLANDEVFRRTAEGMGAIPPILASVIFKNAN
jgi:hypothetical protein